VAGLWLNTGHGHLGWTVGAASGHLLAMQMCGEQPMALGSLDAAAFSPARFGL
jgi:D-amino-acid dehydrogenase